MVAFSNQILLAFSFYDLCCIILTIQKQIIGFKKDTFAPPAPATERQEGRLPPSPACLIECNGKIYYKVNLVTGLILSLTRHFMSALITITGTLEKR